MKNKEYARKTTEKIYEKVKNKYYKSNNINKSYNLFEENKKRNSNRYLFLVKSKNGKNICFQLTSKYKERYLATFWKRSGINKINQWISFEPLVFTNEEIKENEVRIIQNEEIKKEHLKNLRKYSTLENNYHDFYEKCLILLSE